MSRYKTFRFSTSLAFLLIVVFGSALSGNANAAISDDSPVLRSDWYDGTPAYYNCASDHPSSGATAIVGYHTNAPPILFNSIYYIHVMVYAWGDACGGGMTTTIDFALPKNTELAVSEAEPVYCFERAVLKNDDCPQLLPKSTRNPGMYSILSEINDHTWYLGLDENWEFQIPVITSSALVNSPIKAKVQINDGMSDPWLNPVQTITIAGPPINALKRTPMNGAIDRPPTLTLKWDRSPNATSYVYCLRKTPGTTCPSGWKPTGSNNYVTIKAQPSITYYWQVRAINQYGSNDYNNGLWWKFAVIPKPSAFSKTSPVNHATDRSTHPTLYWKASSNARSYEYCLDRLNDNKCGTRWRTTGTNRSVTLSYLVHGETYYWQVRARNASGTTTANAGTWWSFSVIP